MILSIKKTLLITSTLILSACIAPVQPYVPNAHYGVSVQTPRPYYPPNHYYQKPPVYYVKPQHNEHHNHHNEHYDNGRHNGHYKNNKH